MNTKHHRERTLNMETIKAIKRIKGRMVAMLSRRRKAPVGTPAHLSQTPNRRPGVNR